MAVTRSAGVSRSGVAFAGFESLPWVANTGLDRWGAPA